MNPDFPVPFPHSYWVIPGLFLAGEYPGAKNQEEARQKLENLYRAGIRHIINLMEPDETDHSGHPFHSYEGVLKEIARQQGSNISCSRYPIKDLHTPAPDHMVDILHVIDTSLDRRKPVYVHCWGGIGRTGTVVSCFLIRHGLAARQNVLEAIANFRKNDPKAYRTSPETSAQAEFIRNWTRNKTEPPSKLNRYLGCMIGGAVGDAIGASVEFMSLAQIRQTYGKDGISDFE